uniref:Putative secreted peptide n=1 Tax=Anopheles braziliensis TaxID=58242 RepID=A0A2M3ZSQ3_9DIPT
MLQLELLLLLLLLLELLLHLLLQSLRFDCMFRLLDHLARFLHVNADRYDVIDITTRIGNTLDVTFR